jgi:solute carrier family 25 folate transporter 32
MSSAETDSDDAKNAKPDQSRLQIPKKPLTLHDATPHQISQLAVYCAKLPNGSINSFCGAMGGMASGIVTCPLDVIKTRLQAQGSWRRKMNPSAPALYNGMLGTARTIWRQDGLKGMYRGLGPMLLGYLPTWAVYMSVYDGSRDYYSSKVGKITHMRPSNTQVRH